MARKPKLTDDVLYDVAVYFSHPDCNIEIHAELPHQHQAKFEAEYHIATDGYPLPSLTRPYYHIWPEGTNKQGRELRIYFNRVEPEPPIIGRLYTDHGKYGPKNSYRINYSNLVMQLFECGFVLGAVQDTGRIAEFMRRRFPVRG